jgi:hypothetical protein
MKLPLPTGYIADHHELVKSVGDSRDLDPLGQGGFSHYSNLLLGQAVKASPAFPLVNVFRLYT